MGKLIFTALMLTAAVGASGSMAYAQAKKPAKHVHSANETCEKCKDAKKPCKCDDDKHDDHDHAEGSHDHKDEKKAK